MTNDVFQWLDAWWNLAGECAADPQNANTSEPWKWDGWVFRATCLPDQVNDVNIRPLKDFLRAVVALWDPSPVNGPRPTERELMQLSSAAWSVYQAVSRPRDTAGEMSGWHTRPDWWREFGRAGLGKATWCKDRLPNWIRTGLAEAEPQAPERGKLRFATEFLNQMRVTEPA